MMTSNQLVVVAGVDTHADTHHVAVIDATGAKLDDAQFPATRAGYRAVVAFTAALGVVARVGIEGTNSYGAGLTRHLRKAGLDVAEVIRPARQVRRLRGKSDPIDAYAAAAAALAGDDLPVPKAADGTVESIRYLHAARRTAVKARAAAITQIKSLLVTAPDLLRERYSALTPKALIAALSASRPGPVTDRVDHAATHALRHLARRHQQLSTEIADLDSALESLLAVAAPELRAAPGVGMVTAAQLLITAGDNPERLTSEAAFAALCGASPIPASSGKTTRHRLNRGGDRQANSALYRIAIVRMGYDPTTRAYVARKRADGRSNRDIIRCLKRAIAREIYRLLTDPQPLAAVDDLRPLRTSKGITLTDAANHLGVWPSRISGLELGKRRDDDLATTYRRWLNTA